MKVYKDFDSGEIWTEEEFRECYEAFKDELDTPSIDSFEEYLDWMLLIGRYREGGLVEISTVEMAWKVYGAEGHRQRESFNKSHTYDFTEDEDIRIIEVENADITGTNDYTVIRITRNTEAECEEEFFGQLSDGVFENSRTGKIVRIS